MAVITIVAKRYWRCGCGQVRVMPREVVIHEQVCDFAGDAKWATAILTTLSPPVPCEPKWL